MRLLGSLADILWCYLTLPSRSPENTLAALFSPGMAPCKPGESSRGVGMKGRRQASTHPLPDAASHSECIISDKGMEAQVK